jgi:hypothetical protein
MLFLKIEESLDQEDVDHENQGENELDKGLDLKCAAEVKLSKENYFE